MVPGVRLREITRKGDVERGANGLLQGLPETSTHQRILERTTQLMSGELIYGPFISRKQAKAQGLKHYFPGKPCKRGHHSIRFVSSFGCNECVLAHSKTWKAQKRIDDPQWAKAERQSVEAWRLANPERKLAARREWRDSTREDQNAKERERSKKPHRRAAKAKYFRERLKDDPEFRILGILRTRVNNALKGVGSKSAKTLELIGCTVPELWSHLESQFTTGMTRENIGEWHLDHIRPCASFDDLNDPEQQKQCFHYTNLQPLWAEDNLRKSDSWDGEEAA